MKHSLNAPSTFPRLAHADAALCSPRRTGSQRCTEPSDHTDDKCWGSGAVLVALTISARRMAASTTQTVNAEPRVQYSCRTATASAHTSAALLIHGWNRERRLRLRYPQTLLSHSSHPSRLPCLLYAFHARSLDTSGTERGTLLSRFTHASISRGAPAK